MKLHSVFTLRTHIFQFARLSDHGQKQMLNIIQSDVKSSFNLFFLAYYSVKKLCNYQNFQVRRWFTSLKATG